MNEIIILNDSSNAVVAKHTARAYPSILLQGDTLRIVLDDIDELRAELDTGNLDSAKEISCALKKRFVELLTYYENILEQHNLSLPYTNPVRD